MNQGQTKGTDIVEYAKEIMMSTGRYSLYLVSAPEN